MQLLKHVKKDLNFKSCSFLSYYFGKSIFIRFEAKQVAKWFHLVEETFINIWNTVFWTNVQ